MEFEEEGETEEQFCIILYFSSPFYSLSLPSSHLLLSPLLSPSPLPPPSSPIQPLIINLCLLPGHQWWRGWGRGWRGTVCPRCSPFYRTSHLRRTLSSFLFNTQALGGKWLHLSICNSELQILICTCSASSYIPTLPLTAFVCSFVQMTKAMRRPGCNARVLVASYPGSHQEPGYEAK